MKRSTSRILTTHVGCLPRSPELHEMMQANQKGKNVDTEALETEVRRAVGEVVKKQIDAGLDIVNDGELGKTSWSVYVRDRLNGFNGPAEHWPTSLDARDFPEYAERRGLVREPRPSVNGPLSWKDFDAVNKDISNLEAATKGAKVEEVFMTAVSPGTVFNFHPNRFYKTRTEYLHAVSDVMKREYEAIVKAGFVLQLDSPDLALRNTWFPDHSLEEFRKVVAENIEALNYATKDLPADRIRVHVCWGRGEGPKHNDPPLRDLIDHLLQLRPQGLSIVGANGRHEFEWKVWKEVKIPEGMVIIPGVMDNTTNVIEHPEAVAERLGWYASVFGRENVIAGADCGIGSSPTGEIDPKIAYAKFRAMSEGAALATKALWKS